MWVCGCLCMYVYLNVRMSVCMFVCMQGVIGVVYIHKNKSQIASSSSLARRFTLIACLDPSSCGHTEQRSCITKQNRGGLNPPSNTTRGDSKPPSTLPPFTPASRLRATPNQHHRGPNRSLEVCLVLPSYP